MLDGQPEDEIAGSADCRIIYIQQVSLRHNPIQLNKKSMLLCYYGVT